ncbi:MAG: hypothetical protein GY940_18430, partial [bacterium]|nr:hypothetical protein [bacterium]
MMNGQRENDKKITVILPCAGEGSRMGLETPKELFEIFPGNDAAGKSAKGKPVKLIDFSLEHIRAFPDRRALRVAVVVRPWKT